MGPRRRAIPALASAAVLAVMACITGCATLMETIETLGSAEASSPADGLREALRVGTARAVDALSRPDGYSRGECRERKLLLMAYMC